jgi:hypothetical protein
MMATPAIEHIHGTTFCFQPHWRPPCCMTNPTMPRPLLHTANEAIFITMTGEEA